MFKFIRKIIFVSVFVLFFSFLFFQQASAQACCILEHADDTCELEVAQACISIKKSFVEEVINPGINFDLEDNDIPGNDLNKVKVTNNLFRIQGTNQIKFILEEVEGQVKIINPLITDISFSANKSIEYRDIRIEKNPPSPVDISLSATDGLIKGGDIYTGAIWGLASDSGDITVKAKVINISNIIAWGFGGNGGDVTLWGDYIITGGIITSSMIGRPHPDGGDRAFGDAGQITIRRSELDPKVIAIKTGDLHAYGVIPSDIDIQAKELIWVGDILSSSGCNLETRIEFCDYGTLCDVDPITYPKRRYCQNYDTGGKVTLKADGIGKNRGIFIGGEINNSANSNSLFDNTNVDEAESYTGAGLIRRISLTAPNGLVYVNTINSVGSHIQDAQDPDPQKRNALYIEGTWVYIKDRVVTDNFDVHAWPDELVNMGFMQVGDEPGAGDIKIRAVGDLADEPIIVLGSDISAKGQYAFWPNGGNVVIGSNYRIEGDNGLTINSSGRIGFGFFPSDWYVVNGVSERPGMFDVYIFDPVIFCAEGDGENEYYNGTDGSDARPGGNGGNITIAANVIQWNIAGGNLNLSSNGGRGSNGGLGGVGDYCQIDSDGVPPVSGFTGPVNNVVPKIGRGGAGGKGGNGGIINVQANNLHCFDGFDLSSTGGAGGTMGEDVKWTSQAGNYILPIGNEHTGNCDLTGWEFPDEFIPVLTVPKPGGDGGSAGNISLSPMPTDKPVMSVGVYASGGEVDVNGFNFNAVWNDPYPWFCTNISDQFETPCQNSPLDTLLWTDGFRYIYETERTDLDVGQLEPAPYVGQKGPDGGDGGIVTIDSFINPIAGINYDVSGKDGKHGSQGQNSTIEIGGTGGRGGDGGDAGIIKVANPENFDQGQIYNDWALKGGSVGDGGWSGASRIHLPRTSSYFDINGKCQNPANEWWGGWMYSVLVDEIYTLPLAENGQSGLQGQPGAIDPTPLAQPQGTKTCLPLEDRDDIVWIIWREEDIPKIIFIPDINDIPDDFPEDIPILNPEWPGEDPHPVWIPDPDLPPPPDWPENWPIPGSPPPVIPGEVPVEIPVWPEDWPLWEPEPEPNNAPTADNPNYFIGDNCFKIKPSMTFNWTYSDIDNEPPGTDPQSAYQIQIATDNGFNNIVLDSCDPAPGTCAPDHSSNSYTAQQKLDFYQEYFWRVKVWDSGGDQGEGNELDSGWVPGPVIDPIILPPWPDFEWNPREPGEEEDVWFYNRTEDPPSGCFENPCSYIWTFEDGYFRSDDSPATGYPGEEPLEAIYFILDEPPDYRKSVSLSATDALGRECIKPGIVNLEGVRPPKWIEIHPFKR